MQQISATGGWMTRGSKAGVFFPTRTAARGCVWALLALSWLACPLEAAAQGGGGGGGGGIEAIHRSGQTFLTWNEDLGGVGERYRIYRHHEPITEANLGDAALLHEVLEGSGKFYASRYWVVDPQNWRYRYTEHLAIEDMQPALPSGVGLFVWTLQEGDFGGAGQGEAFYAVSTVQPEGSESLAEINGNTRVGPVMERVEAPLPVEIEAYPAQQANGGHVFIQYMDIRAWNPTFHAPNESNTYYGLPPNVTPAGQYAYDYMIFEPQEEVCGGPLTGPVPVQLVLHSWAGGGYGPAESPPGDELCAYTIMPIDQSETWFFGFSRDHDYTLSSDPEEGETIANYTERRILRMIHDLRRDPRFAPWVDMERVYVYFHSMGASGALAMALRYPDVFAAAYASQPVTDYATTGDAGGTDWRANTIRKFGPIELNLPVEISAPAGWGAHLSAYNGTGVWDWQNHAENLRERQGDEMVPFGIAHGTIDFVVEWPTQGQPVYEALDVARRAWGSEIQETGHGSMMFLGLPPTIGADLRSPPFVNLTVVRSESVPGLSNCSANPPLPPVGPSSYNQTLRWAASWDPWDDPPLDEPDRWAMSFCAVSTTSGAACGTGEPQTVDVTPRRLQQFIVAPAMEFAWTNTELAGGTLVDEGLVVADYYGVVTVPAFAVSPTGNRLNLVPTGGIGNLDPRPSFTVATEMGNAPFDAIFDSTESFDPDGQIVTYDWDFGDGESSTEASPHHIYQQAGEYDITLTVFDDVGGTAMTTGHVLVYPAPRLDRPWPDTTSGVHAYADDLPRVISDGQVEFAARHYAAIRSVTRADAGRLRESAPDLLILHERLGLGLGYREIVDDSGCNPSGDWLVNIEGDDSVVEWPGSAIVQDDWFFTPGMTRILNCDGGWYLMDLDDPGWRAYWLDSVTQQIALNDNDGILLDRLVLPTRQGSDRWVPPLPDNDPGYAAAWANRIDDWLTWLAAEPAMQAHQLIARVGAWASEDDESTVYGAADGVFIDAFSTWSGRVQFVFVEWLQQMGRALDATRNGQIVIVQTYAVDTDTARQYAVASYLLVKGDRTYLNIDVDGPDGAMEWWPEYELPIGEALQPPAADIQALDADEDGIYRRDFTNGVALVNPHRRTDDHDPAVTFDLGETLYRPLPTGGGIVRGDGVTTTRLTYEPVTQVTVESLEAVVLIRQPPEQGRLTVERGGTGSGRVTTLLTDRLDCGEQCVADIEIGRSVVLRAEPDEGSVFGGWVGASCPELESCALEITGDLRVTAFFDASGGGPLPETGPVDIGPRPVPQVDGLYLMRLLRGEGGFDGVADTTLDAQSAGASFGGTGEMGVGPDRHGLIRFDLAGVPEDAENIEAELYLTLIDGNVDPAQIVARPLAESWIEGRCSAIEGCAPPDGATWSLRGSDLGPWSVAGAPTDGDGIPGQLSDDGRLVFDISEWVEAWVHGGRPNHGLRLDGPDLELAARLGSSESDTPPVLVIRLESALMGCAGMADGTACTDGMACTSADSCVDGRCIGTPDCPEGTHCDYDNGTCVTRLQCRADADCRDGNLCTHDTCDLETGLCQSIPNEVPCDDRWICTQSGVCDTGVCRIGATDHTVCADAEICTADVCDPLVGCTHPHNQAPCDDGIGCTANDACDQGICVGIVDCPADYICDERFDRCAGDRTIVVARAYNDFGWSTGQLATGITTFTSPNNSVGLPSGGELVSWETGEGMGITLKVQGGRFQSSDSWLGRSPPAGTDAETHFGGVVDTTGMISYINAANSPLVLTLSGLDTRKLYNITFHGDRAAYGWERASRISIVGAGRLTNASSVADDNPALETGALFSDAEAVSTRLPSDNANGYVARFVDVSGGADGEVALVVQADGLRAWRGKYANALLVEVVVPACLRDADCDDGNGCTDETCEIESGRCFVTTREGPCEDGLYCTVGDQCVNRICVSGSADDALCEDGTPCTDHVCDAEQGCQSTTNTATCDDGVACTLDDVCSDGVCSGVPDCLESERCNPLSGLCSAGPLCILDSDCDDGNECTADICDIEAGICRFDNHDAPCDDGIACTQNDRCRDGACTAGTPTAQQCDDGNDCTDDVCNPMTGCSYRPNTGPCDDGIDCTTEDLCADGLCTAGVPRAARCNDGNVCTDDACNPVEGCEHSNNQASCVDSIDCTINDLCVDGACTAGAPTAQRCDDGNVCTDNVCNAVTGCLNPPNTAPCDNGVDCTVGDRCAEGQCIAGVPQHDRCDDGDVCTDDLCDPEIGCGVAYNTADCDDRLACTSNDRCAQGICAGMDTCEGALVCDPGRGLCVTPMGIPIFTAFNDLAWSQAQRSEGITVITAPNGGSGLPSAGELIDFSTGIGTGVTLTIDGGRYNGGGHSIDGREAPEGTDAGIFFTGIVNTLGAVAYVNQANSPLVLTFSDLDPALRYVLVLHGDRGLYGWARASRVTLSGAVERVNQSSVAVDNPEPGSGGALFTGPGDASTRLPADNPNGYVAGFEAIDPGDDGEIVLTVAADGSSGFRGRYASALMLQGLQICDPDGPCEPEPDCVIDADCDDSNVCTDDVCEPVAGRCQSTPNTTACDDGVACTAGDVCGGGVCAGTDACGATEICDVEANACVGEPAEGGFAAYNDLAWTPTQPSAGITTITSPDGGSGLPSQGELLDYATGVGTGIVLTVAGGKYDGRGHGNDGRNASPGSDGHALFDGIVSTRGAIAYVNVADSALVLTFTGLAPNGRYRVALHGDRGSYGWDRASRVTLSGAETFVNDSSAAADNPEENLRGALYADSTSPSTRVPADNPNGYVTRFTGIQPGADGEIALIVTADGTAAPRGKYANAVMLRAEVVGCQSDAQCHDGDPCTDDVCDQVAGQCTQIPNLADCDDGFACTEGDRCLDGQCQGGAINSSLCEDANLCTDDICDPVTGCQYEPNTDGCDDGLVCTSADTCASGLCLGVDECGAGLICSAESNGCQAAGATGWTAYNDLNWIGSGISAANVSAHDYQTEAGALINFETGAPLPVTVTGQVVDGLDPQITGGDASDGTPADTLFGGIVELEGTHELDAVSWQNVITFDHLDPTRSYTITLTANRAYGGYAGARFTRVTLIGADLYTNTSSSGVVVHSEDAVSFSTGYNGAGLVAEWSGIRAASGRFSIRSEWDATLGGGRSNTKGYAMSVFRLVEH